MGISPEEKHVTMLNYCSNDWENRCRVSRNSTHPYHKWTLSLYQQHDDWASFTKTSLETPWDGKKCQRDIELDREAEGKRFMEKGQGGGVINWRDQVQKVKTCSCWCLQLMAEDNKTVMDKHRVDVCSHTFTCFLSSASELHHPRLWY